MVDFDPNHSRRGFPPMQKSTDLIVASRPIVKNWSIPTWGRRRAGLSTHKSTDLVAGSSPTMQNASISEKASTRGVVNTEMGARDFDVVSHCTGFSDSDRDKSTRGALNAQISGIGVVASCTEFVDFDQNHLWRRAHWLHARIDRFGFGVVAHWRRRRAGWSMQKWAGMIATSSPIVQALPIPIGTIRSAGPE